MTMDNMPLCLCTQLLVHLDAMVGYAAALVARASIYTV